METQLRQCYLVKGNFSQTTWLPEKFAIVGNFIKLKDGDKWDDGWKIKAAGPLRPKSEVRDREYTTHRVETDV